MDDSKRGIQIEQIQFAACHAIAHVKRYPTPDYHADRLLSDDLEVTSLDIIEIVFSIEDQLQVQVELEQVGTVRTLGELVAMFAKAAEPSTSKVDGSVTE